MKYLSAMILCLAMATSGLYGQQTVGVFLNDSTAFNGYTLFAPNGSRSTYLIDNCGNLVNQWTSLFRPGLAAYLLEDGSLLRTARISSSFSGGGTGGRIEQYDWNRNMVWSFDYSTSTYHQHHDIEYLSNGNILILAWEFKTEFDALAAGRDPNLIPVTGIWSERVVEIQPVGVDSAVVVWEWHVWDHLIQDFDSTKNNFGVVSEAIGKIDLNYAPLGAGTNGTDWLHCNSIDYNEDLDQILLSSRVWNEVWIIDHSTSSQEAMGSSGGRWGKGGELLYRWGNQRTYQQGSEDDQKLFGQHDAHWIKDGLEDAGKIMIFNNGINRPGLSFSTVDVIEPPVDLDGNYVVEPDSIFGPSDLSWQYQADPPVSLFSINISGAGRLPNGNTLICEGIVGAFYEVDRAGNLVWQYVNPVGTSGPVSQGTPLSAGQNAVFRACRYGPDYPGFDGIDLTPGDPVELNPLSDNCEIFENPVTSVAEPTITHYPYLQSNLVQSRVELKNIRGDNLLVEIVNSGGISLYTESFEDHGDIYVGNLHPGLYFVTIHDEKNLKHYVHKFVKL